jgi:hypothetical protein
MTNPKSNPVMIRSSTQIDDKSGKNKTNDEGDFDE